MIFLTELLLLIISALFGFYIWLKYNLSYWRRKNVAFIKPNIFVGNLKDTLRMSKGAWEIFRDFYNHKIAKDQPIVGFYILNKPALLIRDRELIKSIFVKNFNKFSDRYGSADPKRDPFGSNALILIKNPHWKELRSKLTPVFSSGKIKQMFPLMQDVGNELDKYLLDVEVDEDKSFIKEVKEVCALYTTDVITTVALGIQANCLGNPQSEFRRNGRSVFTFTHRRALELIIVFFIPYLATITRSKLFPKEAEQFIRASINSVMDQRIKSGHTRNDLIDFLIAFKKAAEVNTDLTMHEDVLVATAGTFFAAGYESSSSTMAFCLYELSRNPEIQKRLREEIKGVLQDNNCKLPYEAINEMEYLNMVIMEVLRLYPPLPFLERVSTLPNGETEFSLKPQSDFAIPNNFPIYVSIFGIHRDPQYFPNPELFDPERFSAQNKINIQPYTYMPFGLGLHNCIGERFGLVQVKIGVINSLRNHYVTVRDKSHSEMIFEPKSFMIQSKGGTFCKFVRDPLV